MPPALPYVVFFDGHCQFCTDSVNRLRRFRRRAEVAYVDVHDPAALSAYPQVDPAAALGQMHVLTPSGKVAGGFDAIVALLPALRGLWLAGPMLRLPPIRAVGRATYRFVARNRYRISGTTGCHGGTCRIS